MDPGTIQRVNAELARAGIEQTVVSSEAIVVAGRSGWSTVRAIAIDGCPVRQVNAAAIADGVVILASATVHESAPASELASLVEIVESIKLR